MKTRTVPARLTLSILSAAVALTLGVTWPQDSWAKGGGGGGGGEAANSGCFGWG